MYIHATGTGHGLVAPLALCLRPARKKIFQNCATRDIWNPSYQKSFGNYFFGRGENVCHAGGRATPRVPRPRSQGQLAATCTMVLSCYCKPGCEPGFQWYLKIEFCCLESEIKFRDLIFASLETQECIFTILHSSISKFGMF